MPQKKYQKLQSANLGAAEIIYNALKEEKTISFERFAELYCQRPGGAHRSGSFNNLISTTHTFLRDHGLMTRHIINGLIVYVATQKCFRTKNFYNATKEVQVTCDEDIDRAIDYVTINKNMVPAVVFLGRQMMDASNLPVLDARLNFDLNDAHVVCNCIVDQLCHGNPL